ncbi:MAG: O-methyltransferase [Anaerolineales bacterium]|nr:O-methyltransferase [Anaerolineales bacterium]
MPTYNDELESYLRRTFAAEDEVLKKIREQTPAKGLPAISVKPEEGRFLQFLTAASGAQLALEVGTLGGYSGVWIARGLPPGGRLITLEKEARHAAVAKEHFNLAGVSDRVEVRIGDAHEMLPLLRKEGPFDLIFIDAEKESYPAYLDWALANINPGGVIAAHNVFRHGAITDPANHESQTQTMRAFNQRMANEPRLIAHVFPAGDGMAIAVLKP